MYNEILQRVSQHNWYQAAFGVVKKYYPHIEDDELDNILARCGVKKIACSCSCGYQGSMSPSDYQRLEILISALLSSQGN